MNGLKVNNEILKTIRYATGNQCRALSNGVIWQNLLSSNTRRAAESSGLFAVFESDTLVSRIRGYYSNQGG